MLNNVVYDHLAQKLEEDMSRSDAQGVIDAQLMKMEKDGYLGRILAKIPKCREVGGPVGQDFIDLMHTLSVVAAYQAYVASSQAFSADNMLKKLVEIERKFENNGNEECSYKQAAQLVLNVEIGSAWVDRTEWLGKELLPNRFNINLDVGLSGCCAMRIIGTTVGGSADGPGKVETAVLQARTPGGDIWFEVEKQTEEEWQAASKFAARILEMGIC